MGWNWVVENPADGLVYCCSFARSECEEYVARMESEGVFKGLVIRVWREGDTARFDASFATVAKKRGG